MRFILRHLLALCGVVCLVEHAVPRVQEVVLPILRQALGDGVQVTSWVPDIDYRDYPVVNVRRLGGYRSRQRPLGMDLPVIELTVYHDAGLVETEDLYHQAVDALIQAQRDQTLTDAGYITMVRETMGLTQFSSPFQDTFRIQGLIQLGIKPRKDFHGTKR